MCQPESVGRMRDAMFAAIREINEGNTEKAMTSLKVGLFGGECMNPLDRQRANREWDDFLSRDFEKKAS